MNNIIFVFIKVLRGNFFVLISNKTKKLLFNKSSGNLGFKNIQKRSKDSFQSLLHLSIQYLLSLNIKYKLIVKIDAAKKDILKQVNIKFFNVLRYFNINILAITVINKIAHNGCRKSYFRK
jgi:ribosomal protein S11